jgi:hypothetical protein
MNNINVYKGDSFMKILKKKHFDPKTNKVYQDYKGIPLQVKKLPLFISKFYSQRTDVKFMIGNFDSQRFQIKETDQKKNGTYSWGGKRFKLHASKFLIDEMNTTIINITARYIFIPLILFINGGGHANVLFIDTIRKTIIRYEPFGKQFNFFNDVGVDSLLVNFFKFNSTTSDFKFDNISIVCPRKVGPQHHENITSSEKARGMYGYCMMFSYLFIINIIANPYLRHGKIIEKLLRLDISDTIRRFTNFTMMNNAGKINVTTEEEETEQVIMLLARTIKKRKSASSVTLKKRKSASSVTLKKRKRAA